MTERNDSLLPNEQETVMVYFDPELIQTMADRSAAKRQNFRELLSAAEEGSLDAAYRLGLNYYEGSDGAPKDEAQALRWLTKAAEGEVCFVENLPIAPFAERIEAMVLYDWDRAYPADVHLDLDPAAAGFTLKEERSFPGTSHEKIIRKIYEREAAHGEEEE